MTRRAGYDGWRSWWWVSLGVLAVVWTAPAPVWQHCIGVVLDLNGSTVTLNTDGTWTIPSWDAVHKMAHSGQSNLECMARELLKRRREITLNDHPNNECPAGWYAVSQANPIVKLCSKFDPLHERAV